MDIMAAARTDFKHVSLSLSSYHYGNEYIVGQQCVRQYNMSVHTLSSVHRSILPVAATHCTAYYSFMVCQGNGATGDGIAAGIASDVCPF